MKNEKKFVGLRPLTEVEQENATIAYKICDVANNEILPLMQVLNQAATFDAVCAALKSREGIVEAAVEATLSQPEYTAQPKLLKEAVAQLRRAEVEDLIKGFGTTTIDVPKAEAFCRLSPQGVMEFDEEAVNKRCEVWAEGEAECAIFEAYSKVVTALNELFPKGVPNAHRMAFLFNFTQLGDNAIKVDVARWSALLMEATARR